MKIFQGSIIQRNTTLIEIIQSKQKPNTNTIPILKSSLLINYWLKIFQKRMKIHL